jgi:hypothetical protein
MASAGEFEDASVTFQPRCGQSEIEVTAGEVAEYEFIQMLE